MLASIAHIGAALKVARKQKGISQRNLSIKTKIPQSHISKIENGATDVQISSLIEITRALDLELMFVPRNLVPAFQSLLPGSTSKKTEYEQIPLYRLDQDEENDV